MDLISGPRYRVNQDQNPQADKDTFSRQNLPAFDFDTHSYLQSYIWQNTSKILYGYDGPTDDLISFLGVCQRYKFDFLPISWQPGLELLGLGGQAMINQSLVNAQRSFAFRRMKLIDDEPQIEEIGYQHFKAQVSILGNPHVRNHPHIISLEGICWDIRTNGKVLPVLVFEKSKHGDLCCFMKSDLGKRMSRKEKISLSVDVGTALLALHSSRTSSLKTYLSLKTSQAYTPQGLQISGIPFHFTTESPCAPVPQSWPWTAPEYHHRPCEFTETVRMDVYSFGLTVLWLLFQDRLQQLIAYEFPNLETEAEPRPLNPFSEHEWYLLGQVKRDGALEGIVARMHNTSAGTDDENEVGIADFFAKTLCGDPYNREYDMKALIELLNIDRALKLETPLSSPLIANSSSEAFRITQSASQLYSVEIGVRVSIASSLQNKLSDTLASRRANPEHLQDIALQVALCYELGFGLKRDTVHARQVLAKFGLGEDQLRDCIKPLRAKTDLTFSCENRRFRDLMREGSILSVERDYKDEAGSGTEKRYQQEAEDLDEVLKEDEGPPMACDLVFCLLESLSHWANILKGQESYVRVAAIYRQALLVSKPLASRYNTKFIGLACELAGTLKQLGQYAAAESTFRDALARMKVIVGANDPGTLACASNLAQVLDRQGKYDESERITRETLLKMEPILGRDHPDTLTTMSNLAVVLTLQEKLEEAEQISRKTLDLRQKTLGSLHPNTHISIHILSSVLHGQGRSKEAERTIRELVADKGKTLGPNHPSTLASANLLSTILRDLGKYDESEQIARETLRLSKIHLGTEHFGTVERMHNLALVLILQEKHQESIDILYQTLPLFEQALGEYDTITLSCMHKLAGCLDSQEKYADAELIYRELLDRTGKLFDSKPLHWFEDAWDLAENLKCQRKFAEASILGELVLKGLIENLGARHERSMLCSVFCSELLEEVEHSNIEKSWRSRSNSAP